MKRIIAVTLTLTVAALLTAEANPNLIVYEGFEYFPASADPDPGDNQGTGSDIILTGNPGNPEAHPSDVDAIGLDGIWANAANDAHNMYLVEGSLEFGDLPTSGNHIRYRNNLNSDRYHRSLTEASIGAIANANEIWFSFLAKQNIDVGWDAGYEGFALGSDLAGNDQIRNIDGAGYHGVGVGPANGHKASWTAYAWDGTTSHVSTDAGDRLNTTRGSGATTHLLVGHVHFDEETYTLYEYRLEEENDTMAGGELHEIVALNVDIDRTKLNTLNLTRQVSTAYDEIRIGTTLNSVLGLVDPPAGTIVIVK